MKNKFDKIISFNQKEMKKCQRKGDTKGKMQHYQALEIAKDLKRNLEVK